MNMDSQSVRIPVENLEASPRERESSWKNFSSCLESSQSRWQPSISRSTLVENDKVGGYPP